MRQRDSVVENASDVRQIKRARKLEKLRDQQHIKDVRDVLQTEAGKRVLLYYMGKCNVFSEIYGEAHYVYFEEGRRSIGLNIQADIAQASPQVLADVMQAGVLEDEERRRQAEKHEEEQEAGHETEMGEEE